MNPIPDIHPTRKLRWEPQGLSVAYVSSYPPRQCGIATFCQDMILATNSPEGAGEPIVVAMENARDPQSYTWPVACVVEERSQKDYLAAADFLNDSPAALVSLQHEFGIYGGLESRAICAFLERLEKPLVVTLHTVTPNPGPARRGMLRELAWRADSLVVMNALARDILARDYDISPRKVALIHHGAPESPRSGREAAKARLDLAGRRVLSTFGLVSRGKGLEHMIEALPAVVSRHPQACYVIIGKTHPCVQREEKESYREGLSQRVQELGLQEHVRFVNQYLTKPEIVDYLTATEVYVTPYENPDQIVSGTLAYAVAAGKAIVSTPYLHARFLLGEGRGKLTGFQDSAGMAAAINQILGDPALQQRLEEQTYEYGRNMLWPVVGRHYLRLFQQVLAQREPLFVTPQVAPYAELPRGKEGLHEHPGSRKTSIA